MSGATVRAPVAVQTDGPYEFASSADIIRAAQKDQYYNSVLLEQLRSILRQLAGTRIVNSWSDEIRTAANCLYLGLTTFVGQRTLGEEYCDIAFVNPSGTAIASQARRTLFVSTSTLIPYILHKAWPKLVRKWTENMPQTKSTPWLEALKPYITLRNLESAHLAIFYFYGAYYTISRRVSGMRYKFTRRIDDSTERIGYEVLGFLLLARLAIPLLSQSIPKLFHAQQTKSAQGLETKRTTIDLDDDSIMPFLDEQARKCILCLSDMQDPTATACGHLFCWTCISEWTRTKPECPLCRQDANPAHLLPLRP